MVQAFYHHVHPWPELPIPDNANVFYAMSPAAPRDFVLRRKDGARHTATISST